MLEIFNDPVPGSIARFNYSPPSSVMVLVPRVSDTSPRFLWLESLRLLAVADGQYTRSNAIANRCGGASTAPPRDPTQAAHAGA